MDDLLSRFRILPLLVLVATLAFAVRVGETVTGVRNLAASAIAAEEDAQKKAETDKKAAADTAAKPDAKGDDKAAAPVTPFDKAAADAAADAKAKADTANALPEVWADPAQQNMADSPEQLGLQEDLAKRRQQLEAREKSLDTREALMKASEKQIDEKMSEMTQLKNQIEQLLGQQDVQENNRIQSLVKIYSGMKPKDAAAIFNQMDMGVLLKVVSKMSERKASPILAAMETAKANELTVQLTELRKLPEPDVATGGPAPTDVPPGSAALPGLDALGKPQ